MALPRGSSLGADKKHYYIYILSIILAVATSFWMILNLIDYVFALMAIPKIVATLILVPKVVKEARNYFF